MQVTAADVTPEFVAALENASYGRYSVFDLEGRSCVVAAGQVVRDVLLDIAHELGVFSDCSDFH